MENQQYEQRSNTLRKELKAWEKQFASQHDGRKAGRDDIKANAIISQKYKEYNKLRDILSGKAAPQTPSKRTQSRRLTHDLDRTPRAHRKPSTTTPLKRKRDSGVDFVDDAAITDLLSPQGPAMIGPTPQRDGIVLGLFDLLPAETPSKRRAVLVDVVPNVMQTPSRTYLNTEKEASLDFKARCERTPQSVGKRFMLDKFVTPQKRRRGEEGTPTSALQELSTPAFLRRDNVLSTMGEEDIEATPRPAPWKIRSLGRSLSSMIQSMKKQEEDRLDDEADIMRELEMEAEGVPISKKSKAPKILIQNSQVAMPLGPDGFVHSDNEDDENDTAEGMGRDGKPLRIWKKRGLKRQTRRVIMRPNFVKPAPQPFVPAEDGLDIEGVQETQFNPEEGLGDHDPSADESESEYASDASHTPKRRKTVPKKKTDGEVKPMSTSKPTEEASKSGPVAKVVRKVKATANANYRRLKIKSKGGNGGGGRRFGRR